MGSSARKLALDNLYAALSGISVANGYSTDIASLGRRAIDWDSVYESFALPAVVMVPGKIDYELISRNIMVVNQLVSIEFAYSAATQTEAWDDGDAIIDDLIGAILDDPTRGGNALHTIVVDAETDAGNPDLMDSRGGTAAGIMNLQLRLSRAWSVTP